METLTLNAEPTGSRTKSVESLKRAEFAITITNENDWFKYTLNDHLNLTKSDKKFNAEKTTQLYSSLYKNTIILSLA